MNVGIHRSRLVIHLSESQNEMNLHMRSHMLQINIYADASSRATGEFSSISVLFCMRAAKIVTEPTFSRTKIYRQIRAAVLFHETSCKRLGLLHVKQYCMPLLFRYVQLHKMHKI